MKYKQEEVEIIAVYHNSCILASSIHLLMPAPQLKQEVCEKKKKKRVVCRVQRVKIQIYGTTNIVPKADNVTQMYILKTV